MTHAVRVAYVESQLDPYNLEMLSDLSKNYVPRRDWIRLTDAQRLVQATDVLAEYFASDEVEPHPLAALAIEAADGTGEGDVALWRDIEQMTFAEQDDLCAEVRAHVGLDMHEAPSA